MNLQFFGGRGGGSGRGKSSGSSDGGELGGTVAIYIDKWNPMSITEPQLRDIT